MAGTVTVSAVAAHFALHVGPVGEGQILVNGDDVSALTAGCDLSVRPGQPTTLTLHMLGSATVTGDGIVQCVPPGSDPDDVIAEVCAAIEQLDPDLVFEAAMGSDLAYNPAAAILATVTAILRGEEP